MLGAENQQPSMFDNGYCNTCCELKTKDMITKKEYKKAKKIVKEYKKQLELQNVRHSYTYDEDTNLYITKP